jgi:hypothetical protein
LQTNWPLALRRPEFRKACADFEKARDEAFEEIKANGSTSEEDREKLVQAVVQLASQLERVYPREVRKDTSVFLTYSTARNYLHSLIYQVNRALSTNDKRLLLGGNAFEGKTVLDLFQYMYEMGVVFAPPEPGGERVYKTLMENMRNIYVTLGSE